MVDRRNSTHSPRVDDEMERETASVVRGAPVEAHSRDDLRQEDAGGHPGHRPDGPRTPPGLPEDAMELRSALAASLRPSSFPEDRAALLGTARAEHAPEAVVALLERLPSGATWANLEEVWEAAGGHADRRPGGG